MPVSSSVHKAFNFNPIKTYKLESYGIIRLNENVAHDGKWTSWSWLGSRSGKDVGECMKMIECGKCRHVVMMCESRNNWPEEKSPPPPCVWTHFGTPLLSRSLLFFPLVFMPDLLLFSFSHTHYKHSLVYLGCICKWTHVSCVMLKTHLVWERNSCGKDNNGTWWEAGHRNGRKCWPYSGCLGLIKG